MKEERILPSLSEASDIYDSQIDRSKTVIIFKEYFSFYLKERTMKNFLDQPLKLEYFIPCNDKGEPIEKPHLYEKWLKEGHYPSEFNDTCKEYQQALERTIFEGCHVKKRISDHTYYEVYSGEDLIWVSWNTSKSILDLIGKVSVREWKWNELKLGK